MSGMGLLLGVDHAAAGGGGGNGLLTGLVAYYKLDAAALTADASGGGHTLTNNNSVTTTTGVINEAASLNGINQNLASADAAFALTGTMSVSFWLNPSSVAAGSKNLCVMMHFFGFNCCWDVEINRTAGKIDVISHDGNSVVVTGGTSLSTSTWYHCVAVRSGSAGAWTWTLYLNGSSDGSGNDTSNPSGTGCTMVLAADDNNANNYNGLLDEVGIWSRALSGSDVSNLYNGGSGLPYGSFN